MTGRRFCWLVLLLVLTAVALAGPESGPGVNRFVDGLPDFEVRLHEGGEIRVNLGSNSFTPVQLLQLLLALPEFIEQSSGLADGDSLVLRQAGVTGYVSVTARQLATGVDYLLTFQAEPPASIAGVAALQGLGLELASAMLTLE